jgi:hypothetical protein
VHSPHHWRRRHQREEEIDARLSKGLRKHTVSPTSPNQKFYENNKRHERNANHVSKQKAGCFGSRGDNTFIIELWHCIGTSSEQKAKKNIMDSVKYQKQKDLNFFVFCDIALGMEMSIGIGLALEQRCWLILTLHTYLVERSLTDLASQSGRAS